MSADSRKRAWAKFFSENPMVWKMFRHHTTELIEAGHKTMSHRMIWETIRFNSMLETNGEPFKLNNNHLPFYAKLFMKRYPEYGQVFELREKKSKPKGDLVAEIEKLTA